jgi:hypothetical protein
MKAVYDGFILTSRHQEPDLNMLKRVSKNLTETGRWPIRAVDRSRQT